MAKNKLLSFKKTKLVDGRSVPIYAKEMTKSEYVVFIRDKDKARERDRKWRKENKERYNAYMRDYHRKSKKGFGEPKLVKR